MILVDRVRYSHSVFQDHDRALTLGWGYKRVRNRGRPKTVLTESTGQVGIEVPRDRDGTLKRVDRQR